MSKPSSRPRRSRAIASGLLFAAAALASLFGPAVLSDAPGLAGLAWLAIPPRASIPSELSGLSGPAHRLGSPRSPALWEREALAEPPRRKRTPAPPRPEPPHPAGVAPQAANPAPTILPAPANYESAHFLVHSDLGPKEAKSLLDRLETIQGLIARYWGRPPAGVIECFVVADLKNWPPESLHPAGRAKIEQGGGITLTQTRTLDGQKVEARAVVYAVAKEGVAQHESVHAYCGQTFGTAGPLWYAEGMAEMGNYWRQNDTSVQINPAVLHYLQHSEPQSLDEIVNTNSAVGLVGDSWQNYAWRWALCYMLANNPNYSSRFRPLGLGFLTEQQVSFEETYGAMAKEIDFEYHFFVSHIDQGYREDLCSWDWKKKFKPLFDGSVTTKVDARRGWQPTGAALKTGRRYAYSATGAWKIDPDRPECSADGIAGGKSADAGRLEGILFEDFTLSDPFELGVEGSFTAPRDGQLYVRCADAWGKLADNKGAITLKLRPAGKSDPAPAKAGNESKPGKSAPAPPKPAKAAKL